LVLSLAILTLFPREHRAGGVPRVDNGLELAVLVHGGNDPERDASYPPGRDVLCGARDLGGAAVRRRDLDAHLRETARGRRRASPAAGLEIHAAPSSDAMTNGEGIE
jgi:hypothetical protein